MKPSTDDIERARTTSREGDDGPALRKLGVPTRMLVFADPMLVFPIEKLVFGLEMLAFPT